MRVFLAAAILLLCACAPSGTISVEGRARQVEADDGFGVWVCSIASKGAAGDPRAAAIYVQGSENHSVMDAAPALAGLCAMSIPVHAVERRGVSPGGEVDKKAADEHATLDRRARDTLLAFEAARADAPGKPLIVIGTSEGGDVASRAARLWAESAHERKDKPGTMYVVLMGTGGGMTQEEEFRHFIRARGEYMGMKSERELDEAVAKIKVAPDADTEWLGHPHRRWSAFMFRRAGEDLRVLDCPILVIHGDKDDAVPVESARALQAQFEELGKTNLKVVEIPGSDHAFREAATDKSLLPLVEVAVAAWFKEQGVIGESEWKLFDTRVRKAHKEVFEQR